MHRSAPAVVLTAGLIGSGAALTGLSHVAPVAVAAGVALAAAAFLVVRLSGPRSHPRRGVDGGRPPTPPGVLAAGIVAVFVVDMALLQWGHRDLWTTLAMVADGAAGLTLAVLLGRPVTVDVAPDVPAVVRPVIAPAELAEHLSALGWPEPAPAVVTVTDLPAPPPAVELAVPVDVEGVPAGGAR